MTDDLPTIDSFHARPTPPARGAPWAATVTTLACPAARPGEPSEPRVSYAVEYRYAPRGGGWRSAAGQDWGRLRECATLGEASACRLDVWRRSPDYEYRIVRRESFTVCEGGS